MENIEGNSKLTRKLTSSMDTVPSKTKKESPKRKSVITNDSNVSTVKLKRCKVMIDNSLSSGNTNSTVRRGFTALDLIMDRNNPSHVQIDNASLLSLNFSKYELLRNLSCCSFNTISSERPASGSTGGHADLSFQNEQLERYFRSAEMWSYYRDTSEGGPNQLTEEVNTSDMK